MQTDGIANELWKYPCLQPYNNKYRTKTKDKGCEGFTS